VKSEETWHWREVDLRDWANKRLGELFKGRQIVDTAEVKVIVAPAL